MLIQQLLIFSFTSFCLTEGGLPFQKKKRKKNDVAHDKTLACIFYVIYIQLYIVHDKKRE